MFNKVLSMLPVIISQGFDSLWFWMCQSFGYTRVLNIPLVLNVSLFWIYQRSEYARVTEGSEYAWIIPKYVWICLFMSGYAGICVNRPNLPEWPLSYIFQFLFPFSSHTGKRNDYFTDFEKFQGKQPRWIPILVH